MGNNGAGSRFQLGEFDSVAVDPEYRALFVPVAENDSLALPAIGPHDVHCGPVRVSVNHHADIVTVECVNDRTGIDVENGFAADADLMCPACFTGLGSELPADFKALPQELALPGRITELNAYALIGKVLRAQLITVQQQRGSTVQLDNFVFRHQPHAAARRVRHAKKEVAIAVLKRHGYTGRGQPRQSGGDISRQCAVVVVPDPTLEQISEDVECLGAARFTAQEIQEQRGHVRASRIQMQVRDEEGGQSRLRVRSEFDPLPQSTASSPMIRALSMIAGWIGTSLAKGPFGPVSSARMVSTTSMPEITRANTV